MSLLRRLVIAVLLALPTAAACQSVEAIKAAFIYNFTKYVDWPQSAFEGPGAPIIIGVVGNDSLGGSLEAALDGKTVGGRRLAVKHLRWDSELETCQVLFVPAGEMGNAARLARLKNRPVLTIGESAGFARRVGIINFILEGSHVCFEINGGAARDAGLSISSKLLSLGKAPG